MGNVEYKLKLLCPTASRFEHLVTQMKWRLREGQGEAIYEIGVSDSGMLTGLSQEDMADSITTLRKMADRLAMSYQRVRFLQGLLRHACRAQARLWVQICACIFYQNIH